MDHDLLLNIFIFLAAACVIVPLASRFKLGSVLGYFLVGVLIGPFGFSLIDNVQEIMEFAEFGIIMMLFLIGLELEPETLWNLRKAIMGIGSLQVLLTTGCFFAIGLLFDYPWQSCLAISMALALSSTALVVQMLQEKNLIRTTTGGITFSVLLLQDLAVIPILLILPLLTITHELPPQSIPHGWFAVLPTWTYAGVVAAIIFAIIYISRYLSHHLFFVIAKTNLREVFTATSLAIIVGITLLMQELGISPAVGAFISGVVLANSAYKRTIKIDIEPFKGLLLGLFFISVGMGMNFSLLSVYAGQLLSALVFLVFVKAVILFGLGRLFNLTNSQALAMALSLSQGSEFAFVLFQFASSAQVISQTEANFFILIVALSMALTPLLMLVYQYILAPRLLRTKTKQYDSIDEQYPIILAGYGRFGQIIGRFLSAQRIEMVILEKDAQQIETLSKFGFKGYFGDASRLDVLKNAGAQHAKLLIVAVSDEDTSLEIIKLCKTEFPQLTIYARARNRRHAYKIHQLGVSYFKRDTFDSALSMAVKILEFLGHNRESIRRKAKTFAQHDETSLAKSFAFFEKERELINFSRQATSELEQILQDDQSGR